MLLLKPKAQCGSFNENGPNRLIYLSAWSPVSETFWEGLESVVLLEEECHRVGIL